MRMTRLAVLPLLFFGCLPAGGGDGDGGGTASDASRSKDPGDVPRTPPATDATIAQDGAADPGDALPAEDAATADPDTGEPSPALMDPSLAQEEAPETFTVLMETSQGDLEIDVTRAWAPLGADRFYNLVSIGYYDDVAFFRVLEGFMAQTGIHGDPAVSRVWSQARIQDDPNTQTNTRGRLTYATAGPGTRTTQIFFNFGDNSFLDAPGFSPFGEVRDMAAADALFDGYGEGAPQGNGPNQGRIQAEGNAYLRAEFPDLDYILRARVID